MRCATNQEASWAFSKRYLLQTVLLGKAVATHLHPTGYVHAQTLPSLAHDTAGTVRHALRLVKLYGLAEIPQARVCIKIPSTLEGIAACNELENHHDVRTLATMCFALSQGLAAGEAKCTYVAPYVNQLIVHIDPSKHIFYKDPLPNLTSLQVSFAIQKELKKTGARTKVLAASLITAEECFALCGIEHITLSPAALALLQKTALDARFEGIRDTSLEYLNKEHKHPHNGFWVKALPEAINDPAIAALLDDALQAFGKAEIELREMASKELQE